MVAVLPLRFLLSRALTPTPLSAQSTANNPYRAVYDWGELPGGREMGVVTGVHPDPDGEYVWILERCGANQCAGSDLNPIHKRDPEGNTVKSIGAGLFAWPHGFDLNGEVLMRARSSYLRSSA